MKQNGCESIGNCTDASQNIWGKYSPYFSAPSIIESAIPKGCEVTFAQVLSRHGSRYPTSHKSEAYGALVNRIQNSVQSFAEGYEFIRDYKYKLGSDDLTEFGEMEMFDSGKAFYQRYKDLADAEDLFVRSSGSDRVIASAEKFMQGLYEAQGRKDIKPANDMLILPEGSGFNNSLDHGGCPAFEDGPSSETGSKKQAAWTSVFVPPLQARLNTKLPGANLTTEEVIFFMDLCPFNTVATSNATLSDFCRLFSKDDWQNYGYFGSLDKWYGSGPGNPLGPTQGIGFVNELIARLTGQPVTDSTTTNSTLDSSSDTFPLNRTLYADFSHDNSMTSVYAALGLYDGTEDLPVRYRLPPRKTNGYSAAWTVPFGARLYVEKLQCDSGEQEMVRVLVNDRVIPLRRCKADYLGRCTVGAFVNSLSFAKSGGRWDECFTV